MIKVENVEVWGFEHAIKNMKAKGYRLRKDGYKTFISDKGRSICLGTYKTEEEAKSVIYNYRVQRFINGCKQYGLDPYQGIEYQKKYIVFPSGHILNLHGVEIQGGIDKCGYKHVILNGHNRNVHRIIAEIFLDNPLNLEQVNHINGIKTDNNVTNLEYCSRSDNLKHAYKLGLERRITGEKHHSHKLTNNDVKYIREHCIPRDKEFGFTALAKKFNVDRTTVASVVYMQSWKETI